MRLTVDTPLERLVDADVRSLTVRLASGSFGLLPRHIDTAAVLPPGLLHFEESSGRKRYLAVLDGVLLKQGRSVRVAANRIWESPTLDELERTLLERIEGEDEREKRTRTALARLESDLVRRFAGLELRP